MADPIGIASGIAGLLTFTIKLTGEAMVIISDIQNAPEDIIQLRAELSDLAELIEWTQTLSTRHPLRPEDRPLELTVMKRLESCQQTIDDIKKQLSRFFVKGSGRRSPIQVISWTIRKSEIRDLKDKLSNSRAMLQLSLIVLNAHLSGKGQDEIMEEMHRGIKTLGRQIRNTDEARRLRKRLEEDVESVHMSIVGDTAARKLSMSNATDSELPLSRFLGNNATSLAPPTIASDDGFTATPFNSLDGKNIESAFLEISPLIQAAMAGNTQYVRTLLASFGASANAQDRNGRTALHICAMHDHIETARALIENGAEVDAKGGQSGSPFRTAIVNRSFAVAALLLQSQCDLRRVTRELLLVIASEENTGGNGSLAGYKAFIDALRQRTDVKGSSGPYLAHEAIELSDQAALERLLEAGFDPNRRDECEVTLLHHAILRTQRETVAVLLRHGADPNDLLGPDGFRRLRSNIPWHRWLIEDVHQESSTMALATAANRAKDPEMVLLLLQAGADPNQRFTDGGVVLEALCASEFLASAKHLLNFGANPNLNDGCAIHWALVCGNRDLLAHMLKYRGGIDLNQPCPKSHQNRVPLQTAVLEEEEGMLVMLINAGAKLDVRDTQGRRPIDLMDEVHKCESVRPLLEAKMREQGLLNE